MELIKCLKSIKEHAFETSEYPVVITLEDHLPPNLQAKVAEVRTGLVFLAPPRLVYFKILYNFLNCSRW